jgi:hypothetical protein
VLFGAPFSAPRKYSIGRKNIGLGINIVNVIAPSSVLSRETIEVFSVIGKTYGTPEFAIGNKYWTKLAAGPRV